MSAADELVTAYDRVVELTATTDMSETLQPQFIARMIGAPPADVVAVRTLREQLRATPDDPELETDAGATLDRARALVAAAETYAAENPDRAAGAAGPASALDGDESPGDSAEIECLAFADGVDWLLDATGVAERPADEHVDALAHALRTPRERIRTITDLRTAIDDPDADRGELVAAVQAARPLLDRLIDRVDDGDRDAAAAPPPRRPSGPEAPSEVPPGDGYDASVGGDAGPADGELDELIRRARERADTSAGGGWIERVLIALVIVVAAGLIVAGVVLFVA